VTSARRALGSSRNQLTLERELYYPDSLVRSLLPRCELVGFDPDADSHKLQWLSAAGEAGLRVCSSKSCA